MTKLEFKEITELLMYNYNKTLDIKIISLWYEELKEYPKERYEFAIKEIIKQETFMPNLAKILEYIKNPAWLDIDVPINLASDEEIKKLEERMKNR